jgi:glycosyltransferase involved in cell wall biosynthesis
MNIAIFSPYFYPHKGGLEQFVWEIATRLAKNNFKIVVISSRIGNEPNKEKVQGIEIVRLETRNVAGGVFPIPKICKKNKLLLKDIFKTKFNAIFTNTRFFPLSLWGIFLAKKYKVKSFHFELGTGHPKLSNPLTSFIAYLYDITLGRVVFTSANKCLAISKSSADFSATLGAKDIKVFYNCVDTNFYKPSITSKKEITITFVGRLIEGKGVQDLIRAFKDISEKPMKLIIVGDGNYKDFLEKLAGDDPSIVFTGKKNSIQIKNILNKSSIFVNPSYSEGMPTSVLEAGAMGQAIIATDVGGTREIIENGKNGFLIPPHNPAILSKKLLILIKNRQKIVDFGISVRKKIEQKYDWNNNVKKLMVYLQDNVPKQ